MHEYYSNQSPVLYSHLILLTAVSTTLTGIVCTFPVTPSHAIRSLESKCAAPSKAVEQIDPSFSSHCPPQPRSELPDGRLRPRSYSHLLLSPRLDPLPANGLGVPGPSPLNRLVDVLAPSWLGDPNDDFLPPKPPVTAF